VGGFFFQRRQRTCDLTHCPPKPGDQEANGNKARRESDQTEPFVQHRDSCTNGTEQERNVCRQEAMQPILDHLGFAGDRHDLRVEHVEQRLWINNFVLMRVDQQLDLSLMICPDSCQDHTRRL